MSSVEIPPASNCINCLSISESRTTKSPMTAATPSILTRWFRESRMTFSDCS